MTAPAALQAAPVGYRNYSACLPDFLRELAQRAYLTRNREMAKLTTPAAIEARQQWIRQTFWKLAGGMPEPTPLNARVAGTFEREGYRVEKVLYESVPQFHIPANLYIPTTSKPPYPGVLFQMGHSGNGKAYDSYQRCCQGLARLGYLVLAFDPMGQGERIYYPNASLSATRLRSADEEHTLPGKQMMLLGNTSSRLQVWDAIRSLDYLAAHPMVDPKRLASTGQSGGATLTMLLAAVDDRLAAAAVSMGNTENFACANFNPPGSPDDAEQNLLGSGPLGIDTALTPGIQALAEGVVGTFLGLLSQFGSLPIWSATVIIIAAAMWVVRRRDEAVLMLLGLSAEVASLPHRKKKSLTSVRSFAFRAVNRGNGCRTCPSNDGGIRQIPPFPFARFSIWSKSYSLTP